MTLKITQLAKRYGDTFVFKNVSLSVAPGEFVAIVGESGVGKSTLLNCMAGLDSWDEGSVSLNGADLGQMTDDARALLRRVQVGFVFQAFHVLPHLDVAQNVALPLLLLGQHDDGRVAQMLDAVGLGGLGARLPQQLSGGQLQRVAIARGGESAPGQSRPVAVAHPIVVAASGHPSPPAQRHLTSFQPAHRLVGPTKAKATPRFAPHLNAATHETLGKQNPHAPAAAGRAHRQSFGPNPRRSG